MRLITCNKNYRFLRFLAVFLLAGVLKQQASRKYEPGKNIQICDFTGIVPAAAARFLSNQKRPEERRKCGAF